MTNTRSTEPGRTIFLSGAVSPQYLARASHPELGVLLQPEKKSYVRHIGAFGSWAADNGCFAKGESFDADAWFKWVLELPTSALFVVAPDVVGDAAGTFARSFPWLGRLRRAGHKAAYVAQDGIELEPRRIPWGAFDALFIGGSDEWKLADHTRRGGPLSKTVYELIAEANARGKHTHVGRVNSAARFASCQDAGADTADGTILGIAPKNLSRVLSWVSPELEAVAA